MLRIGNPYGVFIVLTSFRRTFFCLDFAFQQLAGDRIFRKRHHPYRGHFTFPKRHLPRALTLRRLAFLEYDKLLPRPDPLCRDVDHNFIPFYIENAKRRQLDKRIDDIRDNRLAGRLKNLFLKVGFG